VGYVGVGIVAAGVCRWGQRHSQARVGRSVLLEEWGVGFAKGENLKRATSQLKTPNLRIPSSILEKPQL
ncbi:MAG: hypothetical protein PF961_03395, partial [Planctomycetota bacterium]|nr:hypothetical protein [Planctomycetota bacterium]